MLTAPPPNYLPCLPYPHTTQCIEHTIISTLLTMSCFFAWSINKMYYMLFPVYPAVRAVLPHSLPGHWQ